MKTLHLTNAWHASSEGVGTFYKALFETANREGHSMSLVVPGDSTRVESVGEFGRIYYIEAPLAPLDRNYRILYPHRFLFPGTAIQRIINRERPDLIEIAEKYSLPYLGGLLRAGRLPGVAVRPVVVGVSHERMDENMAAWLNDGLLAPIEAMASGLTLIAPNSGGVTSYASRENAWLVSADPQAFACAARYIRSNPAARIEKAILARETACTFCWPAVTSRYLQLYRELIAITHDRRTAPEVPPLSWSTPGDFLGREIPIGH